MSDRMISSGAAAPASKPKKPTMQDDADRIFALQSRMKDASRKTDLAGTVLFLAVIALVTLLIFLLPDKTFSEQENRVLQTFPKVQSAFSGTFAERVKKGKFLDRYFDKKFQSDIPDYFADQFPGRDFFVGMKGVCETALGMGENNGVLRGRDGYLLTKVSAPDRSAMAESAEALRIFRDAMEAEGRPVTMAAAGRTVDIMTDKYPALYEDSRIGDAWEALDETMTDAGVPYLDLRMTLSAHAADGEEVMYRTDHHWTSLGAYYAYCEILRAWDMEPQPLDFFTPERASDEFYGTSWRTAGMKWIDPDPIDYFRYEGDETFTTTIHDNGTTYRGFYDRSYLGVTDKYSSFLSGNFAHTTVERDGGGARPRLFLVKDSFGNSLVPFLAYHFDLEIIDLRGYRLAPADLVRETGCDRVLVLYNMDSMTDSAVLKPLKTGLDGE